MGLVAVERLDGVAVLSLDRPPVNAIDLELLAEASAQLEAILADPPRALVLAGRGRAFCAGLDLRATPAYGPDELAEMIRRLNRTVLHLYAAPVPVVAAVTGHAIAGGLCLALACDLRVCADADCKLGLTEARAGIPFPAGPLAVVRAELAPHVARQLALAARNVSPQQALAWGVVDELQPREKVRDRALELARDLASAPPEAYATIKRQLREQPLAYLSEVVRTGTDPLVGAWLGKGTRDAAARVLAGKAGA